MKSKIALLLALIPAFTWAALCDDTYYLTTVTQTTYAGSNPKSLGNRQVKDIKPDLSDLTILFNQMNYTVLTGFDGSCGKATKPVHFKTKSGTSTTFKDSTSLDYKVQLYDTNTRVNGFDFDYWFGFYKPDSTLRIFLGMDKSKGEIFTSYYVGVYYSDSTRNDSSGLWSKKHVFYALSGPSDSASLDDALLDKTGIRNIVPDASHKDYTFYVQFLKVDYTNTAPHVSIVAPKRIASNFQTSQTGDLVLIQSGLDKSDISTPLSLYGMMGNKVATLHPTGYVYQWNGKTSNGANAPTGVYFVQAGNRTLGKFFYSR